MFFLNNDPILFWYGITRWGEAQVLLPAGLVCILWLSWGNFKSRQGVRASKAARLPSHEGRSLVVWWLLTLAIATALTTASKVAFIAYGFGYAPLNFTGISGHTLFASAVFPLLMMVMGSTASSSIQRAALCVGIFMAVLVGISRHQIGVHSASEIVAGWLLGGAVSALTLINGRWPAPHSRDAAWLPLIVLMLWLPLGAAHLPAARTHQWVVKLSLSLSGRKEPYTRAQMMLEWRLRKERAGSRAQVQ
jgi:membrane-associated phospholipid phosphatase